MNLYDHPVHPLAPERLHFVVETPLGDTHKFKFNPDTQVFEPRPRYPWPIPFHYGFVPGTVLAADDSQLDAILIERFSLEPGQEIEVSPLGLIERIDDDHKLLVSNDTNSCTSEMISEIADTAVRLFNLDPAKRVTAVQGKDRAIEIVQHCIEEWQRQYAD